MKRVFAIFSSMKKNIPALLLLSSLLFFNCSNDSSPSSATDDTITSAGLISKTLTFYDNPTTKTNSVTLTFVKTPLPGHETLWVANKEITCKQYALVMDTSYLPTDANLPQPMTWFNAARFANTLTIKCSLDVIRRNDSLSTNSLPALPNPFWNPYYNTTDIRIPLQQIRNVISPFVFAVNTNQILSSTAVMFQSFEAVKIARYLVFSMNSIDTAASNLDSLLYDCLVAQPDSLWIVNVPAFLLPTDFADTNALRLALRDTAIARCRAASPSAISLNAVRHAYWQTEGDTTDIYNKPATGTAVDTISKHLLMVALTNIPDNTFLRDSVLSGNPPLILPYPNQPITYHSDSLKDTAKTWRKDETSVYADSAFRLPSEDEWEDIAQCGQGLSYSTYNGKLDEEGAVYGVSTAARVGSKKSNPYGIYDLTGNLFEWTNDWWCDPKDDLAQTDLPMYFPTKTIKGGSFSTSSGSTRLKNTGRYSEHPDTLNSQVGVRIVAKHSTFWKNLP